MTRPRIDRGELNAARHKIIDAANKARNDPRIVPPFTMLTIQRAVCVARRRGLVSGTVLAAAGFREAS